MKPLMFTAAAFLVVLVPVSSRAEGLLYRLPDDGTWVKFEMKGNSKEPDGSPDELTGTVTLSSVGKRVVDGLPCRWIELSYEFKHADESSTTILKMLLPEQQLATGKDPLKDVLKLWVLDRDEADDPVEFNNIDETTRLRLDAFSQFLHGPYNKPESLKAATVDCKLGKVECKGVKATETFDRGPISYTAEYTIRLHDKAPTGVASWQSKLQINFNGQSASTTTTLKLVDFGKNAKSALPDAN